MAEMSQPIEIPDRQLFKPAEVCELAKLQPYVLRSWEAEFKDLGVSKSGSTSRVYRRQDVEQVLRIKHLVLIEGLTLAGVRRRLEQEAEPSLEEQVAVVAQPPLATAARERIDEVKRALRSLLDLLGPAEGGATRAEPTAAAEFTLAPPAEQKIATAKAPKRSTASDEDAKSASPRRKRSA